MLRIAMVLLDLTFSAIKQDLAISAWKEAIHKQLSLTWLLLEMSSHVIHKGPFQAHIPSIRITKEEFKSRHVKVFADMFLIRSSQSAELEDIKHS